MYMHTPDPTEGSGRGAAYNPGLAARELMMWRDTFRVEAKRQRCQSDVDPASRCAGPWTAHSPSSTEDSLAPRPPPPGSRTFPSLLTAWRPLAWKSSVTQEQMPGLLFL